MILLSNLLITFSARGVSYLFDIQVKTFDPVYDGEDVIAQARTGTGKTFSFAIPLVEKLQRDSAELIRGRAPKVQAHVHFHSRKSKQVSLHLPVRIYLDVMESLFLYV